MAHSSSSKKPLRYGRIFESGELVASKYRVERLLAEGGMGQVYVAAQEPIGRKVALKILRKALADSDEAITRFFREAVTISQLHHPNTITVLDYGEHDDGTLFIAMEFLDGEDLGTILEQHGRLTPQRTVDIALQVASSLQEAHHKNVLHRDIKPGNIFISQVEGKGELVKVIDFGIAKLIDPPEHEEKVTRMGIVCGTVEYMAPELSSGEKLDGRTDLYALGVMMWELLEGKPPYTGKNPVSIAIAHQTDPIPDLSNAVPKPLRAFIHRAMAKNPQDRPADAATFIKELRQAAADLPTALPHTDALILEFDDVTDIAHHNTLPQTPATPNAIAHGAAPSPTALAPLEAKSKARGPMVAMGILALVGLALGLWIWKGQQTPDTSPAPATTQTTQTTIAIDSNEADVAIFKGKEKLGATPFELQGDPGNKVSLTLKKDGFKTTQIHEAFPADGQTRLKIQMEPTAVQKVFVHVLSEPEKGAVLKAGQRIGTTPHTFELAPDAAPFKVQIEAPKHKTATLLISAVNDKVHSVRLEPDEPPNKPGHVGLKTKPMVKNNKLNTAKKPPAAAKPPQESVKPRVKPPKPAKTDDALPYKPVD